jgi:dihydrofolate reductase
MSLIMIAMMDMANGIGDKDGKLLFNLPKDMARFKSLTTGKHVVMGRKTWDSLPVKPLPKRKNYILTNNKDFTVEGKTKVLHSIEEVLDMAKKKDVYIIGGGEIYKEFLPYADTLLLTFVHKVNIDARSFFPDFRLEDWKLDVDSMRKQEKDAQHEESFTFATYHRISPKQGTQE